MAHPLLTFEQISYELRQRGTVNEFYLDLPNLRTTTIAPGYKKAAVVDYIFFGPQGMRLYDQNDAGHELTEQSLDVLEAILANVQLTERPEGHRGF